MSNAMDQLAEIFGDAEGLGYLDHKYAEVMHADVAALITQLESRVAVAFGELAVAKAEITALEEQRSSTRMYLGVALDGADVEAQDCTPVGDFRAEVKRILKDVGHERKIQCIKELRGSYIAATAWEKLGNGPAQTLNGQRFLGLKEAKDVIDAAGGGVLFCGVAGRFPL